MKYNFYQYTGTLVAKEIHLNATAPQSPFFISGEKTGIYAWGLKALGIQDVTQKVFVEDSNLIYQTFGQQIHCYPLSMAENFQLSYGKRIGFAYVALIFALRTLFSIPDVLRYLSFERFYIGGILIPWILNGFLSWLFYYLYHQSTALSFRISFYNNSGSVSIRLKQSRGRNLINPTLLEPIQKTMEHILKRHSRHFKSV